MHGRLSAADGFAVNILSAAQEAISRRFASRGPKEFSDLPLLPDAACGAPILADCLAWAACRKHSVLPGGDHDIFVGEIVEGAVQSEGQPLLFYGGQYRALADL
jgi:flavin reductase (DIM6/NTAB) family NADH-FMN oxidoreductase RutF